MTGRYGTLGQVFYMKEDFWPLNTSLYVVDFRGNDPRFVAYFLRTVLSRRSSDKAAVPGVNRNHLHGTRVTVTRNLEEQREISSVLAAYDDLIENNERRIRLLEKSARLLYREWFLRFRYPGNDSTMISTGIPNGWKTMMASEVMDVMSGGTPKTGVSAYWDGDIPFFTSKDSTDGVYSYATERTITEDGLRSCNSRIYPKGTVFITARGTVGKVNVAERDMAMNQSCYALLARPPISQNFLFFSIVESIRQFRSQAAGAIFDAITRNTFKRIPFVVPHRNMIRKYDRLMSPILREISLLSSVRRACVRARDSLLPRLMSGEIAL